MTLRQERELSCTGEESVVAYAQHEDDRTYIKVQWRVKMCPFVHKFYLVVHLLLGQIIAVPKTIFAIIPYALGLFSFRVSFWLDMILRNDKVGCWNTYCIPSCFNIIFIFT